MTEHSKDSNSSSDNKWAPNMWIIRRLACLPIVVSGGLLAGVGSKFLAGRLVTTAKKDSRVLPERSASATLRLLTSSGRFGLMQ